MVKFIDVNRAISTTNRKGLGGIMYSGKPATRRHKAIVGAWELLQQIPSIQAPEHDESILSYVSLLSWCWPGHYKTYQH